MSSEMALATRPNGMSIMLSFEEVRDRVRQLDEFYKGAMQRGTDYDVIPGTQKPSLFQPGAQLLDAIFGLVPRFDVMAQSVIDWDREFFHYVIRCSLWRGDQIVAEAIGSCNSREDRYRWRTARQTCPECNAEAIGRSKAEYGGGFFCNRKSGGCGGSFKPGSPQAKAIEKQPQGRAENDDIASLENTICKMAQKRAHIAATLNATGASRIFTQDVEDLPQFQRASAARDAVVEGEVVQATPEPAREAQGTAEEEPKEPPATPAQRSRYDALDHIARAINMSPKPLPDKATEKLADKWIEYLEKALRKEQDEVWAGLLEIAATNAVPVATTSDKFDAADVDARAVMLSELRKALEAF